MPATPEALGLSTERLDHISRYLESTYLSSGRLAGTQLMIHRHGEMAYHSLLGYRDLERGLAMEDDTIFRIYSMTKPITSVALMMLFERGAFRLEEPVHAYIPSWRNLGVFAGGMMSTFRTSKPERPMMIVDLLRHTSGLTYGFQYQNNVDAAYRKLGIGNVSPTGTLEQMIEGLAGLPLVFSPGSAWNYSVSTDVCGYLVEVLSGQRFDVFLKENIFDPLGMTDTAFYVPDAKKDRFAACYEALPSGQIVATPGSAGRIRLQDDPQTSPYLKEPSFFSGGGGLVSTAHDYLRFARMLLNGGELDGVRLLSPKTIALMGANHLPGGSYIADMSQSLFSEVAFDGVGFGLGFAVVEDPARFMMLCSRGEISWGGAANTYFWVDPAEEMIVIFMTQELPSPAYTVRRELRSLVYSCVTETLVK